MNRQQEAELQQRIKKGIQFPEELFKMAEQTGWTIPDYQRLKEHRQKGWPLLKADIANLEAIANGREIEEPRRPSSTVRIERPAKKKRSTATKAEANAKQAAPNKISISPIKIVGQKVFQRTQKTGISKMITIVLNVSGTIIFTTPPKVP